MKSIAFYNNQLQRLSGNLYIPAKCTKSMPAVVLCQGLSGIKTKVLPNIAKLFTESGYITLAFDYSGCGESEGNPQLLLPTQRIDDTRHAIAWLKQQANVDPSEIFIYGISYGAATCIGAAALDDTIKAIAAVSGAADGVAFMQGIRDSDQWLDFKAQLDTALDKRSITGEETMLDLKTLAPFPNKFWEKYNKLDSKSDSESIPEQNNSSTESKQPQFTATSATAMLEFKLAPYLETLTIPSCIIHGEKDNIILLEGVKNTFIKIKAEKELHTLPGCDHIDLDSGEGLKKQVSLAIDWFAQHQQTKKTKQAI